jgi:hypothetical protein
MGKCQERIESEFQVRVSSEKKRARKKNQSNLDLVAPGGSEIFSFSAFFF